MTLALRFQKLTRHATRKLIPGERITEHGITAQRLKDGDLRYTVNIMVDGVRIHRVIGRESEGVTRTQAEDFIEAKRTEAREGRLSLPRGRKLHLTFDSAADLYLRKLSEVGGKDYVKNEQHIRLHLKPYLGKMRLDQISIFTINKLQKHCRNRDLSEATINRILATYRRMGRRLAQWRVIPEPLPMVSLKGEHNRRTYVISEEDETRLLEAARQDSHPYIWLFIKMGLATGLRHAEILASRFEHLDPNRRRLRVSVKGGLQRDQALTRGITEILLRECQMAENPQGWIFPSRRSDSGHVESMTDPFSRCVIRAGLNPKAVTPHTMRHTAITRLAETGADIKTIQEFSGHLSLQMVLRYAHPQDRAINRALDLLESRTLTEHPRARKPADS